MKIDLDNAQKSDVRIEILPMIDVIFCILTFFILAAVGLTRQQAIALDLPSVRSSTPVEGTGRDRLYVSLDSAGQVYVDKSAVSLELLSDVLVQHKQLAPNGTIVLYASRSARYEDVVKVLDLLRLVGGDRVALATLPTDASLDPTQGTSPTLGDALNGRGANPGQPGAVNAPPGTNPGALGNPASPGSLGSPNGGSSGINIQPVPSNGQPSSGGGVLPPISQPQSVPIAPPPVGSQQESGPIRSNDQ
jgi:biopolymer transport protein ExbD